MNQIKTRINNEKKKKGKYLVIKIYFIIIVIFFIIFSFFPYCGPYSLVLWIPYPYDSCYPGITFLIYGGLEGLLFLFLSTILLDENIRFALILNIIGNILISINIYLIYTKNSELGVEGVEVGLGFYLGNFVWIISCFSTLFLFFLYEIERCKTIISSKKKIIVNKIVLIMAFLRSIYPFFSLIFLLSLFLPYYYYISGLFLLIYGGWLGIITLIISIILLYSNRINTSYLLGFCGCIFIGLNLLIYFFINFFNLTTIANMGAFGIGFYIGFVSWIVFLIINIISYKFKDKLILF